MEYSDDSVKITGLNWRRVSAWSLYDFANSPYSAIMTTVGFPIFFTEVIAPGKGGVFGWGSLYGFTMALVALLTPALGAWSDGIGQRKPFLIFFTVLSITGTALCGILGSGDWLLAWFFFGAANVGFGCAMTFYNSLIVEVSPPEKIAFVSGIGWATGYIGGILGLLLALPFLSGGSGSGSHVDVRVSFFLAAAIFVVFAVPLGLMREGRRRPQNLEGTRGLISAYKRVALTLKEARKHRPFFLFIISFFFINDALTTIIIFAGPFARRTFNTGTKDIFILFVALNLVAAVGAFVLGKVAEKAGSLITLIGLTLSWCLLTVGIALVHSEWVFFILAGFAGLLLGSTQAVARAIAAHLSPGGSEGEFFGFYSLAGKFSAVIGPVVFGSASLAFGSMRAGAWSELPFFAVGLFFLLKLLREKSEANNA